MAERESETGTGGGWPRGFDIDAINVQLRAPVAPSGDLLGDRWTLVRLATLAANSHNTQPWQFRFIESGIRIEPDKSRRCPVVDPDDHHLWASLGCAVENIVVAAPALGYRTVVKVEPERDGIDIALVPEATQDASLLAAIPLRQCTRAPFNQRPLSEAHLEALRAAGRRPGIRLTLILEREALAAATALIVEANASQMDERAFVRELTSWIRFNPREAAARGDGLSGHVTGHPSLPTWLGRLIFPMIFNKRSETARIQAQMGGCAGLAVFSSDGDDPVHWVEAGRAYQRFALQATLLGVRHAFLNQPAEVPSVRRRLAASLGLDGRRIDLLVRFGYGQSVPMSLRRAPESVVMDSSG